MALTSRAPTGPMEHFWSFHGANPIEKRSHIMRMELMEQTRSLAPYMCVYAGVYDGAILNFSSISSIPMIYLTKQDTLSP